MRLTLLTGQVDGRFVALHRAPGPGGFSPPRAPASAINPLTDGHDPVIFQRSVSGAVNLTVRDCNPVVSP